MQVHPSAIEEIRRDEDAAYEKMWEEFQETLGTLIRDYRDQGLQANHIAEVLRKEAGDD